MINHLVELLFLKELKGMGNATINKDYANIISFLLIRHLRIVVVGGRIIRLQCSLLWREPYRNANQDVVMIYIYMGG